WRNAYSFDLSPVKTALIAGGLVNGEFNARGASIDHGDRIRHEHDLRSGYEVGAAVDVDESACDAPCERRREVDAGMADVHDVYQLSEGRLVRGLVEEQLEVLDARRRPR